MATTNKQLTAVLNVTSTGSSVSEVLAGLVSDLTAGLQGNTQLAAEFAQLTTVSQTQTEAVTQNTQAVQQNTTAQASSGSGSATTSAGSTLGKILGSGLGLSPLLTGLVSLFTGGGSTPAQPALVKYTPPPSINFEGSITRSEATTASPATSSPPSSAEFQGSITPSEAIAPPLAKYTPPTSIDFEGGTARSDAAAAPAVLRYTPLAPVDLEGGTARSEAAAAPTLLRYAPLPPVDLEGGTARSEAAAAPTLLRYAPLPPINAEGSIPGSGVVAPEPGSGGGTRVSAPQITIQVQAMDSRSFLDHSDQIALAVRQAMLNSHSLNDVVNDL